MCKLLKIIESYSDFTRWVLRDALLRIKWKAVWVLLVGGLGVWLQVSVFALVVAYARHFSSGATLEFSEFSFDVRSSEPLLIVGAAAIVVILSLAAYCVYYFRRSVVHLSREYEEYCAKRVYSLMGKNHRFQVNQEKVDVSYVFRLARTDSKYVSWVLRLLLLLLIPGLMFAFSMAVLYFLEPLLASVITVLGGVFFVYQYRVSKKASRYSMDYEKFNPAVSQEYKGLVGHYLNQMVEADSRGRIEGLFLSDTVKKQLDAYEGRLVVVEDSRFVTGVFAAFIIGLAVLIMGVDIINEGQGWGRLLAFVVALRFATSNLQASFSSITSINRFYHHVRRYMSFIRSFEVEYEEPSLDFDNVNVRLSVDAERVEDSFDSIEVSRGEKVALVYPFGLNRYFVSHLSEQMFCNEKTVNCIKKVTYSGVGHSNPSMSMAELLCLSHDETWASVARYFPDDQLFSEFKYAIGAELDENISDEVWGRVPSHIKFILSLLVAYRTNKEVVFLQESALRLISSERVEFYLELFCDRIIVVVHSPDSDCVGRYGESAVVVSSGTDIVGLGDVLWFNAHKAEIERVSGGLNDAGGRRRPGDLAIDDDLVE